MICPKKRYRVHFFSCVGTQGMSSSTNLLTGHTKVQFSGNNMRALVMYTSLYFFSLKLQTIWYSKPETSTMELRVAVSKTWVLTQSNTYYAHHELVSQAWLAWTGRQVGSLIKRCKAVSHQNKKAYDLYFYNKGLCRLFLFSNPWCLVYSQVCLGLGVENLKPYFSNPFELRLCIILSYNYK